LDTLSHTHTHTHPFDVPVRRSDAGSGRVGRGRHSAGIDGAR